MHQHRVARRIGDVGGDEAVAVARTGGGHGAGHAGRIGRHRVGHVTRLQIGERRAVGDDVLQGAHVRVVDRRLVDIGEHAVGDRVPDLGAGVAGGADAVLASQVEVRRRAGCARCGHGRRPGVAPAGEVGPVATIARDERHSAAMLAPSRCRLVFVRALRAIAASGVPRWIPGRQSVWATPTSRNPGAP